MKLNLALVKNHPYATAATVLIAGLVFYKIYTGGSSSPGTAVATVSAADQQQAAINGQLALQGQQISGQLQGASIQAGTQIQLAQIAASNEQSAQAYQYQIAQLQAAYEVQHDQLNAAVQMATLDSQLQAIQSQNKTLVDQAQIASQAQISAIQASVAQSAIGAQREIQINQANANAAVAQANAAASVGKANASAAKSSAMYSTVGTLALAAALFFCDVQIKTKIDCISSEVCREAIKNLPLDKFVYIMGSRPSLLGDTAEHINTYSRDFYKAIGVSDWETRDRIDVIDMMGVMLGAIKSGIMNEKA